MEEDVDTSPGGDYYTSPSSPTSSSRNWTEDMEGGGAGDGGRSRLSGRGCGVGDYDFRQALRGRWGAGCGPGAARLLGSCGPAGCARLEVKSGFAFPELLGSARAGEGGLSARPDFPALSC